MELNESVEAKVMTDGKWLTRPLDTRRHEVAGEGDAE